MPSQQIQIGYTCYLGDKCHQYYCYLIPDFPDYFLTTKKALRINGFGLMMVLCSGESSKIL